MLTHPRSRLTWLIWVLEGRWRCKASSSSSSSLSTTVESRPVASSVGRVRSVGSSSTLGEHFVGSGLNQTKPDGTLSDQVKRTVALVASFSCRGCLHLVNLLFCSLSLPVLR